jgi:8-oxo-dGTP diphosphatase
MPQQTRFSPETKDQCVRMVFAACRPDESRKAGVCPERQERAGVLVVRDGCVALIERHHDGRHYWVLPGGGVEPSETVEQAATREGREELGVDVVLGALRAVIIHRERDGSFQRQSYFEAAVATAAIGIDGPELDGGRGSYRAVWMRLCDVDPECTMPSAVAQWLKGTAVHWAEDIVFIDERG